MCGEANTAPWDVGFTTGLSPRVRGSQHESQTERRWSGSIPACAGKPRVPTRRQQPPGVYPRVCGEADPVDLQAARLRGLSPRVRGSHVHGREVDVWVGSIPACAGKPATPAGAAPIDRVYPRVCGEADSAPRKMTISQGLSPRVRGSRRQRVRRRPARGSIPACAGKPVR